MEEHHSSLEILLVEDNPGDAKLIEHHLRAPGVDHFTGETNLTHEGTLTDGLTALKEEARPYDLLFLDLNLPDSSGLDTLSRVLAEDPEVPIVVLTGLADRDAAVEAIQNGAQDYLPKTELDADRLARSLRYAVERYRQEEELRRQNQRLERFASMVSHDLRSPLNVALNRTILAEENCESDHLDSALRALNRMQTIVEDLLVLAFHGERVNETERVRLSEVADRSWKMMDRERAELRVENDATFRASTDRLQELLENLFRNAIDHSSDSVTIHVGTIEDPPGFYVSDNGPGISEEMQELVFEFGYSTAEQGTGIGLAIVQEIASAHGWSCNMTESKDGGTRFEITNVEDMTE